MDFELAPRDSDLSVTVSDERLYEELGDQGILGEDVEGHEFFYLAALAIECREDNRYSVERVIVEFIRNSPAVDVTLGKASDIEEILR